MLQLNSKQESLPPARRLHAQKVAERRSGSGGGDQPAGAARGRAVAPLRRPPTGYCTLWLYWRRGARYAASHRPSLRYSTRMRELAWNRYMYVVRNVNEFQT